MSARKTTLTIAFFLVSSLLTVAETAAIAQAVTFSPATPAVGQRVTFTARGFRTPNLLKWDMGDGTILTSGSRAATGQDAVQGHTYTATGRYLVKVFDKGGDSDLPPVIVRITVSAGPNALRHSRSSPAVEYSMTLDETAQSVADDAISAAARAPSSRSSRRKYPFVKLGPYAGYFQTKDPWFKKIYGDGDVLYGARLGIHAWNGFYVWLSMSQFKSINKTTFTGEKTTLIMLPANVFLRFDIGQGFFIPYAGVGYTFMSFREESPDYLGNTEGSGGNFALEAGLELKFNRHVYIDLGARFDKIKFKPDNPALAEVDLGGAQAGVSLLISF